MPTTEALQEPLPPGRPFFPSHAYKILLPTAWSSQDMRAVAHRRYRRMTSELALHAEDLYATLSFTLACCTWSCRAAACVGCYVLTSPVQVSPCWLRLFRCRLAARQCSVTAGVCSGVCKVLSHARDTAPDKRGGWWLGIWKAT